MPVFSFIAFFAGVFWKGGQLTTIIYTNTQCLWQQRWGDEISQPGGGIIFEISVCRDHYNV